MNDSNTKACTMDSRCPRQLSEHPTTFCPLAVMRLRAIRTAGKELSEEEESLLPGCPWSVNHQLANYCFFKYIADYAGDKPPSDLEIAALNNISIDTVKKTEKSALSKIREAKEFAALSASSDDGPIVEDRSIDDGYRVYK